MRFELILSTALDFSTLFRYHISLVELLAACAEGKNVYTEIKCTSLLPLEDVVRVVTHEDCITEVLASSLFLSVSRSCFFILNLHLSQVKMAYVNFVNHCYVDTEVEMKEIYTSNHIWKLFEDFTVDMARVTVHAVQASRHQEVRVVSFVPLIVFYRSVTNERSVCLTQSWRNTS